MTNIPALSHNKLRISLDSNKIPYENSTQIPRSRSHVGLAPQPRASQAFEVALSIKNNGYNIYLAGEPNLGRSFILREYLGPKARKLPTPPDLIYIYNFDDPDKPCLLEVPAGQGKKLRTQLTQVLTSIRKEIPKLLEQEKTISERNQLQKNYQSERTELFNQMSALASEKGFHLDLDRQGSVTLYPFIDGKRLSDDEYEKLDTAARKKYQDIGEELLQSIGGLLRKLSLIEQSLANEERSLERTVIVAILEKYFVPFAEKSVKACNSEALVTYFEKIYADILENAEVFVAKEVTPSQTAPSTNPDALGAGGSPIDNLLYHYSINVFVDNSQSHGAPLILEDHPTIPNLLGCIERESELGALITDFTLIKSGSLHKANGGFLVLRMEDILAQHTAWEGLLRTLRAGVARIEDNSEGEGTKTKSIEPQPMQLDLKVILVGTDELFEMLLYNDERFSKLFKVKAQLSDHTPRNATSIRLYLSRIANIIDKLELLPFEKDALAGLIDYGTWLAEDHKKLSLKFPLLRELMLEASALAKKAHLSSVNGETLQKARVARRYRVNMAEQYFLEEYDREIIKVNTSGEAIGRVNGLSVTSHGDLEFGLPHQIACTVGVGQGGIIDLERDAELGGPIHTKAMMILKNYLLGQFAHNKPLILTGCLCFEQSYAGIEGDSASGAELIALLSAIAQKPVNLSLAFTGAVSLAGDILAVGGVTHKVEAFFAVCKRRGLTGKQGILLPKDNLDHLLVSDEICQAVEQGKFNIYPISHITQAAELLMGLPAGKRKANGTFTQHSLFDLVDKRLIQLTRYATQALRKGNK